VQIEKQYPIKLIQWTHQPFEKFLGLISDNGYNFIFGITPQDPKDPNFCYFNIWIEKRMYNETTKEIVFYAKTYSAFKVKNLNQTPSSQFFFSLIEKATYDFAVQFHEKTKNTNLGHHKILKPQFSDLKMEIDITLEVYNTRIHEPEFNIKPDWQANFRDLPEIPTDKRWTDNSHMTTEQEISFKLNNKQPITTAEETIFKGLTSFYEELDKKLISLNYESFTEVEFKKFKNYLYYAFNYLALISNKLTISRTYRLVVNESVTGKNESINSVNFLKYPRMEIVKKVNKYNRANTLNTNIFYSSEDIDTTLKEIRPPLNKLLTVGVWVPIDATKKFVGYPISHSEVAYKVNKGVQKATKALENYANFNSPLFIDFFRHYSKLLGREYTKKIGHHYEYLISALFSESILAQQYGSKGDFKYDCIVYPSVGNDFLTENLALLPNVLENDFRLDRVLEFEVEEEYYDSTYTSSDPDGITLAKIKNYRKASSITEDGIIQW